jgi:hypothetical protein
MGRFGPVITIIVALLASAQVPDVTACVATAQAESAREAYSLKQGRRLFCATVLPLK